MMTLLMRDQENIEKGIEQGIEKGIEQGIEKGIIMMVENALLTTGSIKQTAEILRLDEERVREIADEKIYLES